VRTRHLSLVTSTPSDTTTTTSNVPSPYGPVRAGLTTWQTTQDQQLTELLNSLENVVASLNSKSSVLYDTLNTAIQGVSAVLNATPIESAGTENC
jgi:hypothetical protein